MWSRWYGTVGDSPYTSPAPQYPTLEIRVKSGESRGRAVRALSPQPLWYKHIGLYVYRRDFLLTFARLAPTPLEEREQLEQLRALEYGYPIRVVETKHDSIGVDTPEDLERIERMVKANELWAAGNA